MKQYDIIISTEAMESIDKLVDYIHSQLEDPRAARQYHDGLIHTIQKLAFYAGSIGTNEFVQAMFGLDARSVIYKKMTIIYVIRGNVVYVKRVIAGSMIH